MNSLTTRAEKPCVDCKWFLSAHGLTRRPARCMHPKTWKPDVVYGMSQWQKSIGSIRAITTACGPEGAWYEPRFMVKVENFLRRELPV